MMIRRYYRLFSLACALAAGGALLLICALSSCRSSRHTSQRQSRETVSFAEASLLVDTLTVVSAARYEETDSAKLTVIDSGCLEVITDSAGLRTIYMWHREIADEIDRQLRMSLAHGAQMSEKSGQIERRDTIATSAAKTTESRQEVNAPGGLLYLFVSLILISGIIFVILRLVEAWIIRRKK